jgi:hypothetical protein
VCAFVCWNVPALRCRDWFAAIVVLSCSRSRSFQRACAHCILLPFLRNGLVSPWASCGSSQWADDPAMIMCTLEDARADILVPFELEDLAPERALKKHKIQSADGSAPRCCAHIGGGNVLYCTGAGGLFYSQLPSSFKMRGASPLSWPLLQASHQDDTLCVRVGGQSVTCAQSWSM